MSIFVLLLTNVQAKEEKMGKFLGAKEYSIPEWFHDSFLDLEEDIEEITLSNKRLILFVSQNSCPYCHRFINRNLKDENTRKKLDKHFKIIHINLFGDKEITDTDGKTYTEKEFSVNRNIQFTPSLLFFDENANQILRLNGYMNTEKFNLALDYIKDKKEKTTTYKDYLQDTKKNTLSTTLNQDKELFTTSSNFSRKNTDKKMAIFFESSNCKECDITHNTLLKNKSTRNNLKKLDVYQVDLNSDEKITIPNGQTVTIKEWTKNLNISNTPTIIYFDENGDEIIRVESLFKTFHFQSIIDYVVSDAYKIEKEFQRYLTNRAHDIREKGKDVNIWK
jgi:thioredoxin-related protein